MAYTFSTNKFHMMGVINITPNSFSDSNFLKNSSDTLLKIQNLYDGGCRIFDFGAESTAPFNDQVSELEELERLRQLFIPLLKEFDFRDCVISIDTYKPRVFEYCYLEIRKKYKGVTVIWNDVSGVVDGDTLGLLRTYSDVIYCLSHTNCPDKASTSSHMDYVTEEMIIPKIINHFSNTINIFKDIGLDNQILLDPCFGFSKSFEQNIELLNNLDVVINSFPLSSWLIGISKKSFLQKSLPVEILSPDKSKNQESSESLHLLYLTKWQKELDVKLCLFRVHNPRVFNESRLVSKI